MNNILRSLVEIPTGVFKACIGNLFHKSHITVKAAISPLAEVTVDRGASVTIKPYFRARGGAHIRIRKGATLDIGSNVSVNHGCMIVCRERITIGENVQFSPNVMVYDHDHDYKADGGIKSMKYLTSPIMIGNNVWIGANAVILRGTIIGDNCVIAAGSVVRGNVPSGSLYYDKRERTVIKK